jgi:glucose-6-phosphate 1-epimerase
LLSYVPAGEKDILWMSEKSVFQDGKAIRGGIPLCFPWFGPHPQDKNKPQHGFARILSWKVAAVKNLSGGETSITLSLQESEFTRTLWPYAFNASIQFVIGKQMQVTLTVTNTDETAFEYSDALHTYFNISDITNISIDGLSQATYFDSFEVNLKTDDAATLIFDGETNRRYANHTSDCVITDNGFKRKILAEKSGSKVTVVWNPWEATTKTMGDMTPEGFKTFVCVEPANAYPGIDMIYLKPGESHTLGTSIEIID